MEYNTQRNRLVIPEYGRNIQKMVEHATTITSKRHESWKKICSAPTNCVESRFGVL